MRSLLVVSFGSALGGVARFWMSGFIADRFGGTFPWGTLAVNVLGSAVIGVLAAFGDSARVGLSSELRNFLMIGLCGGFTTFSSFSVQTLKLVQDGDWLWAGANVVLSVVLCLAAVVAGYWLGRLAG